MLAVILQLEWGRLRADKRRPHNRFHSPAPLTAPLRRHNMAAAPPPHSRWPPPRSGEEPGWLRSARHTQHGRRDATQR